MTRYLTVLPCNVRVSTATVALGLLVVAGCGRDDGRFHLSGSVTHGGQPVPGGSVLLAPDTTAGNEGPAVSVEIREGQYDTRWHGLGHVGGPHVVTVTGHGGGVTDDPDDSDLSVAGAVMFVGHKLHVDLPNADSTQDIEVPADQRAPPIPARLDGP